MSLKNHRSFEVLTPVILIGLLVVSACNFMPREEKPTSTQDTIGTSAAQTIEANGAQQTIQAQAAIITSQALAAQQTAEAMQNPPIPSPEQTEPPQPPPIQTEPPTIPAPQPQEPTIGANIDTKCRQGPSPDYPEVGYLLVGQQSIVHGRNASTTWWLIENHQMPRSLCWVWGETTFVQGDISLIPIIDPEPPPVASPSYQASYSNFHPCGGVEMAVFMVGNTSSVGFLSSSITIVDLSTDTPISGPESSNTPFMASDFKCPPGGNSLGPGATAFIAKGMGFLPPSGTKSRAIILLCTEPNLNGICVENKVKFTFP